MLTKKIFWGFLLLFLTVFSFKDLLQPGYFSMHDDLQIGRLYQMDLCIRDGQFPCRWVPDMGYGYGYPLFNFYPPLPFYVGEIIHIIGFSFIDSIKILFILGLVFSGLFAYLLGKELWGKYGGIVVGIFYLYAPYHAVDVYVRGALNEFWGLVFLPAVFLAIYKIVKEGKKIHIFFLALSFGLLLLSHNLIAAFSSPVLVIWGLFLIWYLKKSWHKIIPLFAGALWGLGLASFFTFPVMFEQKFTHIETMFMGYFNYLAHFATVNQLFFSRFWGFGPSVWGIDDGMPFMVGQAHWIIGIVFTVIFFVLWLEKKSKESLAVGLFFVLFLFSAFLAHERSSFIWTAVPILANVQFPWRFVGFSSFFVSIISGSTFLFIKDEKRAQILALIMISGVVLANYSFFKPENVIPATDNQKLFSAKGWNKLQTDAIFDYLPIYAYMPPVKAAPDQPWFVEGTGGITDFKKGTDWEQFSVSVVSSKATIRLPLYDFPGMTVWVDGRKVATTHDKDLGLITFEIASGISSIKVKLTNTPVRSVSNIISLFSWIGLIGFAIYVKRTSK